MPVGVDLESSQSDLRARRCRSLSDQDVPGVGGVLDNGNNAVVVITLA